jgi:soluble lytic murein transglycosylase-like protein
LKINPEIALPLSLFCAPMRRLFLVMAIGLALVWLAIPGAHAACFLIFCDSAHNPPPHVRQASRRVWPEAQSGLQALVSQAARAAGVPVAIAHAIVRIESGYRPHAVSPAGAIGLGQIKCQTARGLGFSGACARLFQPRVNLAFSMAYLRQAIAKGGATCAGLGLYERGVGARPRCTPYGRKAIQMSRL